MFEFHSSRATLRPHPEEGARPCVHPSRRMRAAPISGLPEIGMFRAQIGYSRLAMLRDAHLTLRARWAPQHEADRVPQPALAPVRFRGDERLRRRRV